MHRSWLKAGSQKELGIVKDLGVCVGGGGEGRREIWNGTGDGVLAKNWQVR